MPYTDEQIVTAIKGEYAILVGGVIEKATVVKYDEQWWPVLRVRRATGELFEVVVSRDDEGNGAGSLWLNSVSDDEPIGEAAFGEPWNEED